MEVSAIAVLNVEIEGEVIEVRTVESVTEVGVWIVINAEVQIEEAQTEAADVEGIAVGTAVQIVAGGIVVGVQLKLLSHAGKYGRSPLKLVGKN